MMGEDLKLLKYEAFHMIVESVNATQAKENPKVPKSAFDLDGQPLDVLWQYITQINADLDENSTDGVGVTREALLTALNQLDKHFIDHIRDETLRDTPSFYRLVLKKIIYDVFEELAVEVATPEHPSLMMLTRELFSELIECINHFKRDRIESKGI